VSLGDLLEWVAGCLLVVAAFLFFGVPVACAVGGVVLFYLAQSLGDVPLWRRKSVQ
jgi:uncharacterized membrane protein YfcA